MQHMKYPLLYSIIISMCMIECAGQILHMTNRIELQGVQTGTAYTCAYIRDMIQNGWSDQQTFTVQIQPPKEFEKFPERTFTTVSETYFDDALFIGDSRMVGMAEYSGLHQATYYAEVGLSVYSMFDKKIAPLADGSMGTLEQALQQKQFGKIYLMVGINELGTGTRETFLKTYKAAIERIAQLQPNAIIFIQGILYVTAERSETDEYINNTNIQARNTDIATLADNQRYFYIDVNTVYDDGSGNLDTQYTFDSAHLKAACYAPWVTFLMEHGIV